MTIKNTQSLFAPKVLFFLGVSVLVFMIGFGAAQFLNFKQIDSLANSQAVGAKLPDVELLALFRRIDWSADNPNDLGLLSEALSQSELLRSEVLKYYQQETEPTTKNNLWKLLTANPLPEIVSVATAWAKQTDNPTTRIDGFKLLI